MPMARAPFLKSKASLPFRFQTLTSLEEYYPADIKNHSTNGHKLCPSQNCKLLPTK